MTGQELYEHVRELARDLDVMLWICLGGNCPPWYGGGWATVTELGHMAVFITQVPDEPVSYFTALHELGHHADPDWGKNPKLDRETYAWRWAISQSLIEPGPEVWASILEALQTYGSDRRYRRTPAFKSLLEEAERNNHARSVA